MSDFRSPRGFEEALRPPVDPRRARITPAVLRPSRNRGQESAARFIRVLRRAPEVMVKVTGRTRDGGHLKAHLDYISRNGDYIVAFDMDQPSTGVQVMIKEGRGMSTAAASGRYVQVGLENLLGQDQPTTIKGEADFNGRGDVVLTPEGGPSILTGYEIAENGAVLIDTPEDRDNFTGWISPDGEVVVLLDSAGEGDTLSFSLLAKAW